MRRLAFIALLSTIVSTPAFAEDVAVDVVAARASLTGAWEGKLEYLDYGANRWFGIPVKTRITDQGDGATMLRISDFDDGPNVGNVRITTVELYDAGKASLTAGTFRKGRTTELSTYTVRVDGAAKDAKHWTMIEEATAQDANRPATLRLTTVRNGDSLETLKEVDFLDDDKSVWLTRNRTRLTRIGD